MNCRSTARGRKVTKSQHSVLGIGYVLQAVNPPTPNFWGEGGKDSCTVYCFCDGSDSVVVVRTCSVTNLSLVQYFGFIFV